MQRRKTEGTFIFAENKRKRSCCIEPDWAYLPVPVLCLILDKLLESIHLIWFGGVCKQWQSVSKDYKAKLQPSRKVLPMLMYHTETERKIAEKRSLYSVAQRQIYNVELSVLECWRFCGSSHGWLARLEEDRAVALFNPFKSSIPPILLPPVTDKHPALDVVSKLILSADPISAADDYVVLVIFKSSAKLLYFKPGFKSWLQVDLETGCCLTDVIFYKGLVYVAHNFGKISWFDVNNESDSPKVKLFAPMIGPTYTWPDLAYLVESSSGNLFYIQRIFHRKKQWDIRRKPGLKVYKLRLDNQSGEVLEGIEVKSLDGDALFVGDFSHSISVSAANFPGCQQNSIYFAHEYNFHFDFLGRGFNTYVPHDVGVFNVENGSLVQQCPYDRYMLRTIWITPPF